MDAILFPWLIGEEELDHRTLRSLARRLKEKEPRLVLHGKKGR